MARKKTPQKKVTAAKKTPKKKVISPSVPPTPPVEEGKYKMTVLMNDESFEIQTNDMLSAILSLKPSFLKTRVIFRVENTETGNAVEKILIIPKAKQIFSHELTATFFVKNLKLAIHG